MGSQLHKILGFVSVFLAVASFTQFMAISSYHSRTKNLETITEQMHQICHAMRAFPSLSFYALPSVLSPTSSSFLPSSSPFALPSLLHLLLPCFLPFLPSRMFSHQPKFLIFVLHKCGSLQFARSCNPMVCKFLLNTLPLMALISENQSYYGNYQTKEIFLL